MSAFILVFNHPFFALTDTDGRYRIDNVPPGMYSVVAWNEGLASEPRVAVVPDGGLRNSTSSCDDAALSLRSRIFLTSALLAVLSIGAAIYLVSVRVTRELEESLQRENCLHRRARGTAANHARADVRDDGPSDGGRPELKAAVDTNDPATVQDNAKDYQTS
jgi:protocatechuate 3,4-dioxygenase beta subunit